MILGAGPFQLPAIRKALNCGYWVATADNLPNNLGHRYSHHFVNCSTRDREGVLQAAKELAVDGICTFASDIAIPTVGFVCDQLKLNGVSLKAAETMSNKQAFRTFQHDTSLTCPGFISGQTYESVLPSLRELKFPVIVKPVDSSGSRGVSRVNRPVSDALYSAFHYARSYSHMGEVCIEEFIHGTEIGGDAMLADGILKFIAITHKHSNGFIVTGHSIPSNIPSEDMERVARALRHCCDLLGYTDGPLNFDVIVNTDSIAIVELSARNGGNGIPAVIRLSSGIDMEEITLRFAASDQHQSLFSSCYPYETCSGSLVFGTDRGGTVRTVPSLEDLQAQVSGVIDLLLRVQPGDSLEPFVNNGEMAGYTIFQYDHPHEYDRIVSRLLESIHIEVT